MTRARGGDEELAADFAEWGIDDDDALAAMSDPDFEVEPENWVAVCLFLRVQTQWTVGAMGHRVGLNYPGVEACARLSGVDLTPDLFAQIQLLELTVIGEQARHGKTAGRSRDLRRR